MIASAAPRRRETPARLRTARARTETGCPPECLRAFSSTFANALSICTGSTLTIDGASSQIDSAKAAHIALPACAWAEVDGTYVNRQGTAQRSERALKPRGDARPGWELVARLARALGYAMDWKKLSDVHRAMAPEAFARAFSEKGAEGDKPAASDDRALTENKAEIRA